MKKILLTILLFALTLQGAFASKLPNDLWEYIKKDFPNATQRFDSVVVISKDVMYIPLYPAQKADVEAIKIDYTYPDKGFKALPEVLIFNNNFVLLKLFKDKDGVFTIVNNENLPLKVKLGIMPQDMLVPPGMKVSENLKLILGDLVVPSIEEGTLIVSPNGEEKTSKKALSGLIRTHEFPLESDNFSTIDELKDKKIYISSNGSKFINVYDDSSSKPLYELKLNGLPSKIGVSHKLKLAPVLYFQNKNVEILDLNNERVLTEVALEGIPNDILIEPEKDTAYISAPQNNTIYVLDIPSANLMKAIQTTQAPSKMVFHTDRKSIAFVDWATQDLYVLELTDNYATRFIAKTQNLSGLIFDGENIYTASRTQNKLIIYDRITGAVQNEVRLHKKPTDAFLYDDKLFVLCAGEGMIDVYGINEKKIIKTVQLDKKGFYSKMTKIPNSHKMLVTGVDTNKFVVLDCEKAAIVEQKPLEIQVSNLIIIDK